MSREVAIHVQNVTKLFRVPYERHTSLRQHAAHLFRPIRYRTFEAVRDLSFSVEKGEFFGIVGKNGCGKSTLLKMLAGIYQPSKGSISVRGFISPFIELGVGFNPEFSARENIFLNGAILGLNRKQLEKRFDAILAFAELEDFVDQKLKNFSSGMQVRLAFSVAVQAEADILLIDEVLAVGDASFQKKCFDVFRRLKREGWTIVFVTHGMGSVQEFCDRVLVMHEGREVAIVGPDQAADLYNQINASHDLPKVEALVARTRWGTGKVRTEDVTFHDTQGRPLRVFNTDDPMVVRVTFRSDTDASLPLLVRLSFHATDETHMAESTSGERTLLAKHGFVEFRIPQLPFAEGTYRVSVALSDPATAEIYDDVSKGYSFGVIGQPRAAGLVSLLGTWIAPGLHKKKHSF